MFQKNIEAIKQKNSFLAEKLEKIDLELIKDNIVVAEAETKDLIIGYQNIALHSTIDPIRESNALWNKAIKLDLKKNDIQIVFGLGLGYLFKRAYVNSSSKIFIVEPILDVLRFVLEHVDLSAELSDNRVYIADNADDVVNKLNAEFMQGDKTEFLYLPAYASLAKECMHDLTTKVVNLMEEKSSDNNTLFKLAPIGVQNFISNLPYLFEFRPLSFFTDVFSDKAALILTSGPGLTENIEKIKQNKDKFVTISTGNTLKELVENDIIPDFITFSASNGIENQIKGLEKTIEEATVIMDSKSEPKIAGSKIKNKILYLSGTDPFIGLFNNNNIAGNEPVNNVLTMSYFIAKNLGFRNIAFVGLDLDSPDNKPFLRQFEEILEKETGLSRLVTTSKSNYSVNGMDYVEFDAFAESISTQSININEALSPIFKDTEAKWGECMEKITAEIYGKKAEIQQLNEDMASSINDLRNLIETMENDLSSNHDQDQINDLKLTLNDLRNKILSNIILQPALQGELWNYTKEYKTNNLLDQNVILNNLKVEEKFLIKVCEYLTDILNYMEKSFEGARQLNRI